MRTRLVVVTCITVLLSGLGVRAQQGAGGDESVGLRYGGEGDVAHYITYMPATTLRASSVLDLAKPELPKSLKEVVEVAFAEMEKTTGKKPGWTCTMVQLLQPGVYNNHKDVDGKWFYLVWLQGPASNPGRLMVPVTLDGRPGTVKKEN